MLQLPVWNLLTQFYAQPISWDRMGKGGRVAHGPRKESGMIGKRLYPRDLRKNKQGVVQSGLDIREVRETSTQRQVVQKVEGHMSRKPGHRAL